MCFLQLIEWSPRLKIVCLQELLDEGARTIAFVGMPPIGCLPSIITLHSDNAFHHRTCIETLSSPSRYYNQLLQENLKVIQTSSNAIILYADIYSPFSDLIKSKSKYGTYGIILSNLTPFSFYYYSLFISLTDFSFF